MGGNQVLGFLVALTLQEADPHQLFDNTGTGGRRTQALAFCILRHLICTGGLHALKQRVLGEVLGGRGLAGLDFGAADCQLLPHRNGGKRLLCIVGFCRTLILYKGLPAVIQDGLALGRKSGAAAVQLDDGFGVAMGITHSHAQPVGNQLQDLQLALGKLAQVVLLKLSGGDDGMVVGDLLVVHDLLRMDGSVIHAFCGKGLEGHTHQLGQTGSHVVSQEPAVGTGIGDELLFVEVLGVIQGLLCRVAQLPVGVTL